MKYNVTFLCSVWKWRSLTVGPV